MEITPEFIETIVTAMLRHPDPEAGQDEMLPVIESCGLSPREAWRVYQFLPISFVHVALAETGVRFQPDYFTADPVTNTRIRHQLADEPLYLAGVACAKCMLANGYSLTQLKPVYQQSGEYQCIKELAETPQELENSDIVCTEPFLLEFDDTP